MPPQFPGGQAPRVAFGRLTQRMCALQGGARNAKMKPPTVREVSKAIDMRAAKAVEGTGPPTSASPDSVSAVLGGRRLTRADTLHVITEQLVLMAPEGRRPVGAAVCAEIRDLWVEAQRELWPALPDSPARETFVAELRTQVLVPLGGDLEGIGYRLRQLLPDRAAAVSASSLEAVADGLRVPRRWELHGLLALVDRDGRSPSPPARQSLMLAYVDLLRERDPGGYEHFVMEEELDALREYAAGLEDKSRVCLEQKVRAAEQRNQRLRDDLATATARHVACIGQKDAEIEGLRAELAAARDAAARERVAAAAGNLGFGPHDAMDQESSVPALVTAGSAPDVDGRPVRARPRPVNRPGSWSEQQLCRPYVPAYDPQPPPGPPQREPHYGPVESGLPAEITATIHAPRRRGEPVVWQPRKDLAHAPATASDASEAMPHPVVSSRLTDEDAQVNGPDRTPTTDRPEIAPVTPRPLWDVFDVFRRGRGKHARRP